ncbi:UDP-galactopyranose mutase [Methanosarcina sp. 2.H.T.1A.6]|uniref:protoporphyrinogen/coproporphyrinogen oxidase n=1 Tax=unclassified Methanosarcina TaxID=2644672 RepID=UPI000621925E|nr:MULTISPECIES: NAD(P)/FAD-dependent oxidoreductase [unclassified Methanosarcina]KKG11548.1 UDP-galactopyranose mutase [Methanosarcina sp. 2.H.T.1A.15]KKG14693.1 UDP-galactopyranose mutase [Methanosarcina sp. 2.H.T.1A.3]KKG20174.1 UDP-galactopyranose mutase [Methanosarcina sp. 2.H.T.1A.6]KKG26897.1 UDP-galactopyranose mutase [Methanosarcina sp. 2.H.T.1A.8]
MTKYDVIVVGAGVSGLLAALTLSKHGKKVLVLEKERYLGGNCNSYMVDGYQVDTGAHAITHLIEGPLPRLIDNYFDFLPVFEDYGHYYVRTENSFTKIPSNLKDFVTFDVLPRKDRLVLSQALTKALTLSSFGVDLSDQSVYEFLPKNLCKDTYDFVDTISGFLSGKSMKETSAQRILSGSSFVRDSITQEQFDAMVGKIEPKKRQSTESILSSILPYHLHASLQARMDRVARPFTSLERLATNKVNYSQGYPRKGLKALLNAILYSLPETVDIKKECEVKSILVQNGKISGVEADEIYSADLVIYTGFATELPGLVKDLPPAYNEELKGIVHTKSLTVWLGLKEELPEFNYTGSEIWFKDFAYWAMPISNYDPSLAPKDRQLVGFSFVIDKEQTEEHELKKAYDTIFRALPNIEKYIDMQHEQIMIPEKAAVTIDGKFAEIRTPVKNLYIAGTDTDKRSMGITRASYSIIELLKILNEDGNLH